jgi:hypothetical protein
MGKNIHFYQPKSEVHYSLRLYLEGDQNQLQADYFEVVSQHLNETYL